MHFLQVGEAEATHERKRTAHSQVCGPARRGQEGEDRETGEKEGDGPPGPGTPCLSGPVPGFQVLAVTLDPCPPCHLLSSHSPQGHHPALKGEGGGHPNTDSRAGNFPSARGRSRGLSKQVSKPLVSTLARRSASGSQSPNWLSRVPDPRRSWAPPAAPGVVKGPGGGLQSRLGLRWTAAWLPAASGLGSLPRLPARRNLLGGPPLPQPDAGRDWPMPGWSSVNKQAASPDRWTRPPAPPCPRPALGTGPTVRATGSDPPRGPRRS